MKAPQARSTIQTALRYFEQRKDLFSLLAVVVILALCGYVMSHLLAKMRLADIGPAVSALPVRALAKSLAFTAASFVTLVGYDWSAMRYIGQRLPIRTLALASFCGYAIGNTVGFSLLTGGSVRFRIYSAAGVRTDDIGRVADPALEDRRLLEERRLDGAVAVARRQARPDRLEPDHRRALGQRRR